MDEVYLEFKKIELLRKPEEFIQIELSRVYFCRGFRSRLSSYSMIQNFPLKRKERIRVHFQPSNSSEIFPCRKPTHQFLDF